MPPPGAAAEGHETPELPPKDEFAFEPSTTPEARSRSGSKPLPSRPVTPGLSSSPVPPPRVLQSTPTSISLSPPPPAVPPKPSRISRPPGDSQRHEGPHVLRMHHSVSIDEGLDRIRHQDDGSSDFLTPPRPPPKETKPPFPASWQHSSSRSLGSEERRILNGVRDDHHDEGRDEAEDDIDDTMMAATLGENGKGVSKSRSMQSIVHSSRKKAIRMTKAFNQHVVQPLSESVKTTMSSIDSALNDNVSSSSSTPDHHHHHSDGDETRGSRSNTLPSHLKGLFRNILSRHGSESDLSGTASAVSGGGPMSAAALLAMVSQNFDDPNYVLPELPDEAAQDDFFSSVQWAHVVDVVEDSVRELRARGLGEEGIFRVPGAFAEIRNALQKYRLDKVNGKIRFGEISNSFTVASLLKQYLRDTGIIPKHLYSYLDHAVQPLMRKATSNAIAQLEHLQQEQRHQSGQEDGQAEPHDAAAEQAQEATPAEAPSTDPRVADIELIQRVLFAFEPELYATVRCLILLLFDITLEAESNKMDSSNLARCFGPSLFVDMNVSIATAVVTTLIDHKDAFFPSS